MTLPEETRRQGKPVVTIDGTNAVGKGTLGRNLSQHLGWPYLDTGLIYRGAGVEVDAMGVDVGDPVAAAKAVKQVKFEIGPSNELIINGQPPALEALRSHQAGELASRIGFHPAVRAYLQEVQRQFAELGDVIIDGRDIGTVIVPDARYKLFLTARPEVRAQRRVDEMKRKGIAADYNQILEDVNRRDKRDIGRPTDPTHPAKDALVVDTSDLTPQQLFQKVLEELKL